MTHITLNLGSSAVRNATVPGDDIARDLLDNPPIGHSSPGGGGLAWEDIVGDGRRYEAELLAGDCRNEWRPRTAQIVLYRDRDYDIQPYHAVEMQVRLSSPHTLGWPKDATVEEMQRLTLPLLLAEAERAVDALRRIVYGGAS